MANVSDIRDQIKDDLVIVGSTDYDNQIDKAIQSALRALRKRKYWFLEKKDNLTLASGDSSLTLPTDFSCADTFQLISGGTRLRHNYGFDFLDHNDLEEVYYDVDPLPTGQPAACAVLNGTLYFSHIADQAYTIPAVYFQQDATLPTASQSSVWFDDGYDVVRSLAQLIFKRDSQHYTAAEEDGNMYDRYLNTLDRQHERYEGSR